MKGIHILSLLIPAAQALTPTATIDIYTASSTSGSDSGTTSITSQQPYFSIYASTALFGPSLDFESLLPVNQPLDDEAQLYQPQTVLKGAIPLQLQLPPPENEYLCHEEQSLSSPLDAPKIYLIPRGNCTYEQKVLNAQLLGASGVIVYNTLNSLYKVKDTITTTSNSSDTNTTSSNDTTMEDIKNDIQWPEVERHYECSNAQAWIPSNQLSFDTTKSLPYNSQVNDAILVGPSNDGNLCALADYNNDAESFHDKCISERCLITGRMIDLDGDAGGNNISISSHRMEACCAWDMYAYLGRNKASTATISIPSVFITMRDGTELLNLLHYQERHGNGQVYVTMYKRFYPWVNASSFLICALGIFVVWLSSWLSAREYRKIYYKLVRLEQVNIHGRATARGRGAHSGRDRPIARRRREPSEQNHPSGQQQSVEGQQQYSASGDPNIPTDPTEDIVAVTSEGLNVDTSPREGIERARQPPIIRVGSFTGPGTTRERTRTSSSGGDGASPPSSSPPISLNTPRMTSPLRTSTRHDLQSDAENQNNTAPSSSSLSTPPPLAESTPPTTSNDIHANSQRQDLDILELRLVHVIIFVLAASASLFFLFYFKIYIIVRILYTIGASGAMGRVVFYPFYKWIAKKMGARAMLEKRPLAGIGLCRTRCCMICGHLTWLDWISAISSFLIGLVWLVYGLTVIDGEMDAFYWIVQNVMGASLCIVFLSMIRLNSIKVATVLLLAAFIYDIFFVFITPLFMGESVMMTVATSGEQLEDELINFCEKYPSNRKCMGGNPLPMLLAMPLINDYRGGMALLGLGDIILPGLLLSFAARYDVSKRLASSFGMQFWAARASVATDVTINRSPSQTDGSYQSGHKLFDGYFIWLVIAYSVGLMLANLAMHMMQRGQPALLYLVPFCLGTIVLLGLRRRELQDLWEGPKSLKISQYAADTVRGISYNVNWVDFVDTDSDSDHDDMEEEGNGFDDDTIVASGHRRGVPETHSIT